MDGNSVHAFFTWSSLGTLAGASGAVWAVTNTVRKVAGIGSPAIPFFVAVLITLGGAYEADALQGLGAWGLALLNACLLFCTATGVQEVTAEAVTPREPEGGTPQRREKIEWFSSWIR